MRYVKRPLKIDFYNDMKKYILYTLLLGMSSYVFAQQTPTVKDTITKAATKTDTTEKPEKTPEQKRAEEYAKLIKKAGVDMEKEDYLNAAFAVFERRLDEFEALVEKLGLA